MKIKLTFKDGGVVYTNEFGKEQQKEMTDFYSRLFEIADTWQSWELIKD
jgi:hypothetical protein